LEPVDVTVIAPVESMVVVEVPPNAALAKTDKRVVDALTILSNCVELA